MRPVVLLLTTCLFLSAARTSGAQGALSTQQSLGRDILRELIERNTTYSGGSTTKAAEGMAARFRAAGFPAADVQIVGPDTGRDAKDKNLIVRYRGRGARSRSCSLGTLTSSRRDARIGSSTRSSSPSATATSTAAGRST